MKVRHFGILQGMPLYIVCWWQHSRVGEAGVFRISVLFEEKTSVTQSLI